MNSLNRFNKMIKLSALVIFCLSVFLVNTARAESVQIVTYLHDPSAVYHQLRLVPQSTLIGTCESIGTIAVESPDLVRYCSETGWTSLPTAWEEGTEALHPIIYPGETDPAMKVGILTNDPQDKLHIQETALPNAHILSSLAGLSVENSVAGLQIVGKGNSFLLSHIIMTEAGNPINYQWTLNHWGSSLNQRFGINYGETTVANFTPYDFINNEYLSILPGGNIGFGAANPQSALHIDTNLYSNPIDWSTETNSALTGDLTIADPNATLSLIGQDESAYAGFFRLMDITDTSSEPGNMVDAWTVFQSTHVDGDPKLYFVFNDIPNYNWKFHQNTDNQQVIQAGIIDPSTRIVEHAGGMIGIKTQSDNVLYALHTHLPTSSYAVIEDSAPALKIIDEDDSRYFQLITGSNDHLLLQTSTDGSSWTSRMSLSAPSDTVKNVGIGTENPRESLNVIGDVAVIGPDPDVIFYETTGTFQGWKLTVDNGNLSIFHDDDNTDDFNNATELWQLSSDGTVYIGGHTGGKVNVNGDVFATVAIYETSSRDLKHNITPLLEADALAAFNTLEPVTFKYKPEYNSNGKTQIGFIAEDVPDLLATPNRDAVSALEVSALLTRVIQSQQKTIEANQQKIDEINQKLENSF